MNTAHTLSHCSAAIEVPAQFCRDLVGAIVKLKSRLIAKYERSHPGRSHVIRQAVTEAEALAWETAFPHLFLPDFAEARVAEIVATCEPVFARAA
jgi:hypothetical protein